MKTAVLMVILSMLDNGQMSSAFINTPGLAACQQKSRIMRTILTRGKVDIREIKCVASPLRFEKFNHKTAADAPRYLYSLQLDDYSVVVTPLDNLAACKKQQTSVKPDDKTRLFCTSSTQKINTDH
jgi:hypothetical protein